MYSIRISPAEEHPEVVVRFRQEICRVIGIAASDSNTQPLNCATYLFVERDREPVGMVELFFYDQRFATYADRCMLGLLISRRSRRCTSWRTYAA
jgi:hypothetical protein